MKLYGAWSNLFPDAEADIAADGGQEGIFKLGSVRVPGLEGFDERRTVGSGVVEMPQTDDGGPATLIIVVLMTHHPWQTGSILGLKGVAAPGSCGRSSKQQSNNGKQQNGQPAPVECRPCCFVGKIHDSSPPE
jgi:hypothetical protein